MEFARELAQAEGRAQAAEARVEELRRENERLLAERQAARADAERALAALDTARGDADHWRARWHELGTAWMEFWTSVRALGWWRRRKLPDPPEACRAQPRVRG
jgi:hypothetical protein